MRIQYISDIHLEFFKHLPKQFLRSDADILCIAGDVGYPFSSLYSDFLKQVSQDFKKVFLIAGNHEYYSAGANKGYDISEIDEQINSIINENHLHNVTYLDNSHEDYNGYRFVGSTLWSRLNSPQKYINDFHLIPEMTEELYNILHQISREFLQSDIVVKSPLPVIVMTHHLPSRSLIDEKYKTNKYNDYNQFFASECEDLFAPTIKGWIYGHTHSENKQHINGIEFVCNPLGYPGENKRENVQGVCLNLQ
jgi:predicted phosphodiesterase